MSTIRDLKMLDLSEEVEYLKAWITERDLCSIYAPRDYLGSDPIRELERHARWMDVLKAAIDYDKDTYVITAPNETLTRSFDETGLLNIVRDMAGCIRKERAIVDHWFEMKYLQPDSPF